MDRLAIEAATKEIHELCKETGDLHQAVTRMWINSGHNTPLMEAAFANYQETR
jgi:hypothetical protein